jgi:DNA-binding Lrp family transcriptional regulator
LGVEDPGSNPKERPVSKNLQDLDDLDLALLRELVRDGRRPNNALAERIGVAASTALTRLRLLRERGVVRGIHADVDPARVGAPVQAIISLRLRTHDAAHVLGFARRVSQLPEVIQVFHVSGSEDFLVHVAVETTEALRDFALDSLTSDPAVAQAQTHLVFEHRRGGFMA